MKYGRFGLDLLLTTTFSPSIRWLELEAVFTRGEVFQEIVHRFRPSSMP